MSLINIILVALGVSMDAFAVSISNGIVMKDSNIKNAMKFGLTFGGFQFIMPLIGYFCANIFKSQIQAFDHWVAFILLTFIGGKMIYETFKSEEYIENSEKDIVSVKNLIILGIATSIDALAVGVSFYALKVNILVSSILIGFVTFLFSLVGILIGKKLGEIFSKNAERIGGIILIFIGLKILVEHVMF